MARGGRGVRDQHQRCRFGERARRDGDGGGAFRAVDVDGAGLDRGIDALASVGFHVWTDVSILQKIFGGDASLPPSEKLFPMQDLSE